MDSGVTPWEAEEESVMIVSDLNCCGQGGEESTLLICDVCHWLRMERLGEERTTIDW